MDKIERLFIIDVMAMAFRSYHAMGRRPLQTAKGFPTSAIFGSAMFILKLLEEEKPDYLLFASDSAEKTFRHAMYPRYKANRREMPQDLAVQIPEIYRMLATWGFPLLRQGGVEADDLIGSVVKQFAAPNRHCYIVSGDKDFMQLISEEVFLYSPKKGGNAERIGCAEVCQRFACNPQQVIDILALWGDSSDNVPGVPGIGEKGAAKLLAKFGSLAGLYDRLEEVSNKKHQDLLAQHREQAFLSRQLVTIKTDIPLKADLLPLGFDYRQALANAPILTFFREMEFLTLAKRIRDYLGPSAEPEVEEEPAFKLGQPSRVEEEAPVRVMVHEVGRSYHLVQTPAALKNFLERLAKVDRVAFDTETTGLNVVQDRPIGVSFALQGKEAFYLPLLAKHLKGLEPADVLAALTTIFKRPNLTKVAHNLKFDLQMLKNLGLEVKGPFGDSMLAAFILDSTSPSFGIDYLAQRYLKVEKVPTSDLIGKKGEIAMANVELERLYRYACEDADCCLRLYELFRARLAEHGLTSIYEEVDLPLCRVLAALEQEGIYVEGEILADISEKLVDEALALEKEIYSLAGESFNINSPKQLAGILYEKLKIPETLGIKRIKKTKSGYSTDVSVLEGLAAHPLPAKILAYRSVTKLKSTYVDALPQLIDEKTGRVHTSFHQTGTATGRLSSSHPNLQNIPIRTEQGREIRRAFRGERGWLMVSADYSQIELRILAHMANDSQLIKAFQSGQDIHTATAATMFKKAPAEVSSLDRSKAKAINYGIIYGMGAQRLAQSTGVSVREAKEFIERYFETFPAIGGFIAGLVSTAEKLGYTTTITGRRRYIEGLDGSKGPLARVNARNMAINSPIQGSAADLMKIAMVKIFNRLADSKLRSKMLLQVHDELVFDCPPEERDVLIDIVRKEMESAMDLAVPLQVDIGCGSNWLEAH